MLKWKLRQVMAQKPWTNRELAKAVGVHETTISRLKTRNDVPRLEPALLEGLLRELECTANDLIE
jgi:putative transcriptional regulator